MTQPAANNLTRTVSTAPANSLPAPTSESGKLLGLTQVQWVLILSGVAFIFALRRWRFLQQRKAKQAPLKIAQAAKESVEGHPAALSMRDVTMQIQALLRDVEDTARRAAAQVDNRYVKLEVLLTEADEKIKRLEELSRLLAGTPEAAEGIKTASRMRETLADSENAAHGPIYQLADAGMPAREIAQKLGKQPGEIELILALRTSGKR